MTVTNTTPLAATYVASGVINLTGAHDMTISGKSIAGGSSACITLTNCHDVTIQYNKLYNSTNVGIYLYNCYNITVTGNFVTKVSTGVYAQQCPSGGIAVTSNQFLNMAGPFPRGQFVQFNNVNGGNCIASNKCENIMGQSNPEDAISIYQCHGTAAHPITITGNQIRGGGPSTSGGGIMLGDSGGSYIYAANNILVNPGQYGIAISGGDHNIINGNQIYSAAKSFTNIGLYVETIGSAPVVAPTVENNKVNFYNASGVENAAWLADGITTPAGWATNTWGANITASILPATLITAN